MLDYFFDYFFKDFVLFARGCVSINHLCAGACRSQRGCGIPGAGVTNICELLCTVTEVQTLVLVRGESCILSHQAIPQAPHVLLIYYQTTVSRQLIHLGFQQTVNWPLFSWVLQRFKLGFWMTIFYQHDKKLSPLVRLSLPALWIWNLPSLQTMAKESLRLSPILLLGNISWCILNKLDSFLFLAEVKADSLGFLETAQMSGNQMLSFLNGLGFGLCNLFVYQAAGILFSSCRIWILYVEYFDASCHLYTKLCSMLHLTAMGITKFLHSRDRTFKLGKPWAQCVWVFTAQCCVHSTVGVVQGRVKTH